MITPAARPRHDAAPIPPTTSAMPTERRALDHALAALRDNARRFARTAPAAKAALVRSCLPRLADCAHLRTFRQEYGRKARAGLLLHTGRNVEWLTPDVLAVPWWRVL